LKDNTGAPCFVETVPRRGYRFLAPLEKVEQSGGPAAQPFVAPDRSDTVPATKPRTWWRSKWILAGGGVALAALLVVAIWFAVFRAQSEAIDSVAVLPFDNASTDSDTEIPERRIYRNFDRAIVSNTPAEGHGAKYCVPGYKGSHIDPQKVGRDLKVRAVLTGKSLAARRTLTISMEVDRRQGRITVVGRQYSRKLADTLAVQEDIAHEVTGKLRLRLAGVEEKRLTAHVTEKLRPISSI